MDIRNDQAGDYIADRATFTNHGGSFWGTRNPWSVGMLPPAEQTRFEVAVDSGKMVYAVYSYTTPIAWYVIGAGWTMPDVRYSSTTSRHQGIVRRAIADTQSSASRQHYIDTGHYLTQEA